MKITSDEKEEFVVLEFEGSFSVENLKMLEKTLNKYYEMSKNIIVDLSGVTFLDSSSLGVIVLYFTKMEDIDRHLILIKVKQDIYQMFNITGLSRRFNVFTTLEKAISFLHD